MARGGLGAGVGVEKGDGEEPASGGGVRGRSGWRLSDPKRGRREGNPSSFFPGKRVTFLSFQGKKKVAPMLGVGRVGGWAELTIQSQDTAEDCTAASVALGRERGGRRSCAAGRSRV